MRVNINVGASIRMSRACRSRYVPQVLSLQSQSAVREHHQHQAGTKLETREGLSHWQCGYSPYLLITWRLKHTGVVKNVGHYHKYDSTAELDIETIKIFSLAPRDFAV